MTSFRDAFRLSKLEVANSTPPGTVTLIEHLEWTASQSSHDEIRRVPQPSTDPADPLNFPFWRRVAILGCMSVFAFVANFTASSIASALPYYAAAPVLGLPPKTFPQLTHLIAVAVLMLGTSNLWWVPLANTFGRRPIVLISLAILILSSAWAGLATSYSSLIAARIFMGIGAGSADSVAPDVVGEIFFVHQRGRAMAVYTVFLAMGSQIGPIIGGYIVSAHGFHWLHWTNVILACGTFALCFIFQSETLYERDYSLDSAGSALGEKIQTDMMEDTTPLPHGTTYRPYTFARSLKIGTYRPGIISKFIAPFLTLRLPGVWLIALWYAGLVGATVAMTTVGPTLVAKPPYLWGKNSGLINVGGVIGTLVGALYAYLVADWITKREAKKDIRGFSEPESRLPTALPSLFIATSGIIIFGFCAQNPLPKAWIGMEVGIGMNSFGLMQAPSIGFNYIIESYPSISGDCFVAITSTRAVVAFAYSFFVGRWADTKGPAEPFGIFGMLMGIFGLLTLPVYIFGKRMRIATAKWVPQGTAL